MSSFSPLFIASILYDGILDEISLNSIYILYTGKSSFSSASFFGEVIITAVSKSSFLRVFLSSKSSAIISATISLAPSIASFSFSTPSSELINSTALSSTFSTPSSNTILRGSKPFSLAALALVLFFCLNGAYMSSTSWRVIAFSSDALILSVSFPCSSIKLNTLSFLSDNELRYLSLSSKSLSKLSLAPPVISFLYLAINGIVLPSFISSIILST